MALHKNQELSLTIETLSSDGSGVGHFEGEAVFVPATVPGDTVQLRIVKDCKRYAFGRLLRVEIPGPGRIPEACAVAHSCGGCCFWQLTYPAELQAKQGFVQDAFARLGGLTTPLLPILPSPQAERYRNKAQYPVQRTADGQIVAGFYAPRSHRVIPCADCLLQPAIFGEIVQFLCAQFAALGIAPYEEAQSTGLVRHIFLRQGAHSGQILVCLVLNGAALPQADALCAALIKAFPAVTTVLLNHNTRNTNVILGPKSTVLYGPGFIEDTLADVPVRLGPLSFYQVNTAAAEQLYAVARQFAGLRPTDTLLDLYCGMGTIGLSMLADCAALVGVEVVPEAVESARQNATQMGAQHARFLCADAGQAAAQLAKEGLQPDVIVLDPPRKGCDTATLEAVVQMRPRTIVMISCNPATAARDVRALADQRYVAQKVQPVDLFPRTKHVETVCLLSKLRADHHIEVELNLDEMDLTAAESKATYEEIKAYVLEHSGLKVSSLYISQVKRKLGLEVGANYNLTKSEDSKQPQCPPDKEAAIMSALKHYNMI